MDLATLLLSGIGAVAAIAATVVAWWMPLSGRVRDRLAQDEPLIEFSMGGHESERLRIVIECRRARAHDFSISIDRVSHALPVPEMRPEPGPANPLAFGLSNLAPLPAQIQTVRLHYRDGHGRQYYVEKDATAVQHSWGIAVNTGREARLHRPKVGIREVWRFRGIV